MSLEELQKALDEVEAIVWAVCEFGSLGREKMNVLMNHFATFKLLNMVVPRTEYEKTQKDWARDRDAMFDYLSEAEELKRKIKEFKAEYDGQVHVSRKQLSDFLKERAFCPNMLVWDDEEYKNCDKKDCNKCEHFSELISVDILKELFGSSVCKPDSGKESK